MDVAKIAPTNHYFCYFPIINITETWLVMKRIVEYPTQSMDVSVALASVTNERNTWGMEELKRDLNLVVG